MEIRWEDDGSFYLGKGVDKNNIIELIFEIIGKMNDFIVEIADLDNDLSNISKIIEQFNVRDIISDLIFVDANKKYNYTVTEINKAEN